MWPKVLMQLVELLPHVSRLVPMADRFFASKTAAERANEVAMAEIAESVRSDLGQVTSAHSGLYRQLQEQTAQIAVATTETHEARLAVVSRLEVLEKQVALVRMWVQVGTSVLAVGMVVVIVLLARR